MVMSKCKNYIIFTEDTPVYLTGMGSLSHFNFSRPENCHKSTLDSQIITLC